LNRLLFKKGGIEKDLIEINGAWEDHIIYSLEK
jgi:RimJ/RimL family protein N-acetyltransferase